MPLTEWQQDLLETLDEVECLGEFAVSSAVTPPLLHPKITIDGFSEDRLSFPISRQLAESIRDSSVCEKAPFGKGFDTVLDESVRKTWQIDASKVKFHNDNGGESPKSAPSPWESFLQTTTKSITREMGLSSTQLACVKSNLYKMLLYEKGSFFVKHRDSEKEPGMFGTLVIQLPSLYKGGELEIQHGGVKKIIDHSAKSQDGFFATAFFADCEHELKPVTEGFRVVLVYNLVMAHNRDPSFLPSASALMEEQMRLQKLGWESKSVCHSYLLEHKYTQTNLRIANMKGRDRVVVDLLRSAKDADGNLLFTVSFVLIERWVSGSPSYEHESSYKRRRYYSDDDESDDDDRSHVMEEVLDESTSIKLWLGPDGTPYCNSQLKKPSNLENSLLMDCHDLGDLFDEDDDKPDEQQFEGYTGNAGPSLEYWYYRSAVVICPMQNMSKFANILGLKAMASICLVYKDSLPPTLTGTVAKNLVKEFKANYKGYLTEHSISQCMTKLKTLGVISTIIDFLAILPTSGHVHVSSDIIDLYQTSQNAEEKELIAQYLRRRINVLKEETKGGKPAFSWSQPNAVFTGSGGDIVQAFLRSDKKEKVFGHFNDSRYVKVKDDCRVVLHALFVSSPLSNDIFVLLWHFAMSTYQPCSKLGQQVLWIYEEWHFQSHGQS